MECDIAVKFEDINAAMTCIVGTVSCSLFLSRHDVLMGTFWMTLRAEFNARRVWSALSSEVGCISGLAIPYLLSSLSVKQSRLAEPFCGAVRACCCPCSPGSLNPSCLTCGFGSSHVAASSRLSRLDRFLHRRPCDTKHRTVRIIHSQQPPTRAWFFL